MKLISNPKLFFDMDGCMVDLVGHIHNSFGIPVDPWPIPGEDSFSKAFKINEDEVIWKHTTRDFWADAPKTKEADALMDLATSYNFDIWICTSPKLDATCLPGKTEWVKRHYPELARKIVFCKNKAAISNLGTILVDDSDYHIDAFMGGGGYPILVPRPWNSRYRATDRVLEIVTDSLFMYCAAREWSQL